MTSAHTRKYTEEQKIKVSVLSLKEAMRNFLHVMSQTFKYVVFFIVHVIFLNLICLFSQTIHLFSPDFTEFSSFTHYLFIFTCVFFIQFFCFNFCLFTQYIYFYMRFFLMISLFSNVMFHTTYLL